MPADTAAILATGAFFNPLILLFLAGFSMSAAFDAHGISQIAAATILRKAGTSPPRVILALMAGCVIASSLLGNVAAAVLASSLLRPTLSTPVARNSAWPQAALLGVGYACNVRIACLCHDTLCARAHSVSLPRPVVARGLIWLGGLPTSFLLASNFKRIEKDMRAPGWRHDVARGVTAEPDCSDGDPDGDPRCGGGHSAGAGHGGSVSPHFSSSRVSRRRAGPPLHPPPHARPQVTSPHSRR
jgi:hypothetical protein